MDSHEELELANELGVDLVRLIVRDDQLGFCYRAKTLIDADHGIVDLAPAILALLYAQLLNQFIGRPLLLGGAKDGQADIVLIAGIRKKQLLFINDQLAIGLGEADVLNLAQGQLMLGD